MQIMTSATTQTPEKNVEAGSRRRLRQERQSRVGILRNPNMPPRPPPRRAALMGKWLRLRSARRPPPGGIHLLPDEDAVPLPSGVAETPPHSPPAVVTDSSGRVEAIDISGLMASVDGLGKVQAPRASFGAELQLEQRANHPDSRAPPAQSRVSVLTPQAWLDDVAEPPGIEDEVRSPPHARTRPGHLLALGKVVLLVAGGLGLALLFLSLLPIMG